MFDFGCFPFSRSKFEKSNFIGLDSEIFEELGRFVPEEISLPDRSFQILEDSALSGSENFIDRNFQKLQESGLSESQNFIDKIFEFHKTENTGLSDFFDDSSFLKNKGVPLEKKEESFLPILTKEIKCGFCEGRNHFPEDCTGFTTFSERIRKFQDHRGDDCFFCGSRKNPCICQSRCPVCFGKHHVAICSRSLSKSRENMFIDPIPILTLEEDLIKKLSKLCSRLDRLKLFISSKSLKTLIHPEKVLIVESISVSKSFFSLLSFSRDFRGEKIDQMKVFELVKLKKMELQHCNLELVSCQYLTWPEFCFLTPPGLDRVKISKSRIISCPGFEKVLSRLDSATNIHLGVRNMRIPRNWTTVLLDWKRKTKLESFVFEVSLGKIEKTKIRNLVKFIKNQEKNFHLRIKIIRYELLKRNEFHDFIRSLKSYFIVLNMEKETARTRFASRSTNPSVSVENGRTIFHCFFIFLISTMPSTFTSTPKSSNAPPCAIDESPGALFSTPEIATMKHASLLQLNPQSVSKIASVFYRESLQKESEAFFALSVLVVFIAAHFITFFWFVYQLNRACIFDFVLLGIEVFLIFSIMASCCLRNHFSKFYPVFLLGLSSLLTGFVIRIIVFFINNHLFKDTSKSVLIYTISVGILSIISVIIARAKDEKENFESFQKSRRIILV